MFAHVLIPTDGSPVSTNAVQRGITFAKSNAARVTLLHVSPTYRHVTEEGYLVPTSNLRRGAWEASMNERAATLLASGVAAAKKAGVTCDTIHVFHDQNYKAILDTAQKAGCDVIVMGSHGYGSVKQIMLGSETTRVLSHSKIPVLVIR